MDPRDAVLGSVSSRHQLEGSSDATAPMRLQHAGIPHLGLAIGTDDQVAQTNDLLAIAGYENGFGPGSGRLHHHADPARKGWIFPVDLRLVGHIALDLHRAAVELLARVAGVDFGKRRR